MSSKVGLVKVLQDWDDIQKMALKGRENDPFIVTSDRTLDRVVLEEARRDFGKTVRPSKQMSQDAWMPICHHLTRFRHLAI